VLAAAAACLLALVAGSSGLIHGLSASAPGGGIHQGVAALATTATPTPLPTPTTVPTPTPVPTPPPFSACSTVSSANLSVPVLEYHFVRTVNGAQDPLGWSLSTTPANFAEEMALLAYDHVHVMTMSEFTSDLAAHQQPTCKSVVLTFDDGLLSMATAVAPLSPRARQGATVSMPLPWGQIRAGLDPSRFTVRTVPALLAKLKPWEDYAGAAASLRTAIERFTQSGERPVAKSARPTRKTPRRSRSR